MKAKIGLVTLGVGDLARAVTFYRDGLGLPIRDYDPAQGSPSSRSREPGSLFPREELAADAGVSAAGEGFRAITLAHNEPSAAAVDAVFAEALAAGATAVKIPAETSWGGYSGYFADPDGHLWEVAYNPFTDLT